MRHFTWFGIALALILPSLAPSAMAQPSINYPAFLFNSPFQDNGNARGVNFSTLLMTTDAGQTSSTFVIAPQDVTQSFAANFNFYMGPGGVFNSSTGTGPGGLAFVIQGDPRGATALGNGQTQLGYGDGVANTGQAILNSLALTYTTFAGTDQFELFANTSNTNFNATGIPLAVQTGSENLSNLLTQVTLDYQAPDITYPDGAVTVLLNGNSIGMNNVGLPASLATLAGGSNAIFGFTASTGGAIGTGPYIEINSLVAGAVPEPCTAAILVVGAGVAVMGRRRGSLRLR
jgi:hypothetical protein